MRPSMANTTKKAKSPLEMFQLKHYPTWQLVLILIVFSIITATLLRFNNVGMARRLEALQGADQAGDEALMQERLVDLQVYVSKHMNTSTGAFFLENQYKHDSEGAIERAKQASLHNPHGNIYKKASDVCDPHYIWYSSPYFQCIMTELAKYPAAEIGSTEVKLPVPELYRHDFVSPAWTPDFAGFAVIIWFILVITIIVRTISKTILILILKRTKSGF